MSSRRPVNSEVMLLSQIDMGSSEPKKDWKLDLRYGRLNTPFQHFTVLAEGIVGQLSEGYSCRPGPGFMGMKTWASSEDEAADMLRLFANHVGFTITGNIEIYASEPLSPPSDNPSGYDINFTPFDDAGDIGAT